MAIEKYCVVKFENDKYGVRRETTYGFWFLKFTYFEYLSAVSSSWFDVSTRRHHTFLDFETETFAQNVLRKYLSDIARSVDFGKEIDCK